MVERFEAKYWNVESPDFLETEAAYNAVFDTLAAKINFDDFNNSLPCPVIYAIDRDIEALIAMPIDEVPDISEEPFHWDMCQGCLDNRTVRHLPGGNKVARYLLDILKPRA
jgi:hypothetical protein